MGHHLFLSGVVTAAVFLQGFEGLMIDSPRPIVALAGNDIVLPCHLEPTADVSGQTVEWSRPGTKKRFVHVHRDGKELSDIKDKSYLCRTELFVNELKNGNISLKLLRVEFSDEGQYRCFIPSLNSESFIQLLMGIVSRPITFIVGPKDGGVDLHCESGGWYPEPEVEWLDSEGHVLSAGPTETLKDPDRTYTVRRQVTVYQTDTNRFTCRVQQRHINQTREREIHVPDGLFPVPPWKLVLWVLGGVVALVVVAFLFIGIKRHFKRDRHNTNIKKAVRETETFKRVIDSLESKLKHTQEQLDSQQQRPKELEEAKKKQAKIELSRSLTKIELSRSLTKIELSRSLKDIQELINVLEESDTKDKLDRVEKICKDLQQVKEHTEAELKRHTEEHEEGMDMGPGNPEDTPSTHPEIEHELIGYLSLLAERPRRFSLLSPYRRSLRGDQGGEPRREMELHFTAPHSCDNNVLHTDIVACAVFRN